jgi:O-antigen/teichoic acid export membrane protein
LDVEVSAVLNPELRQSLRHAAGVLALRVIETAGGLILITLVPRIMGPVAYGQFSLLHSLSLWFSLMSGLGTVSIMTRFVPEFLERNDRAGLTKLASGLMGLRILGGTGVGVSFFIVTAIWLGELDFVSIGLVGLSAAVRSTANLPFTVLLGMNQAARWAMAEMFRRGLMAPAVYAGFQMDGLRGACGSLLVVEVAVLALGLWWGRDFLSWPGLWTSYDFLRPFLKFSAGFFAGNLIFTVFMRMGSPLVKLLSGSYADVAHYSIAYGAYLAGAHAITAVFNAMGPRLSAMRVRGELDGVRNWIWGLMTVSGLASVLAAASVYCYADKLVNWALGKGYEPVVPIVNWLCLAGVLMIPGGLARVVAVVFGLSKVTIVGSAIQLVVFAALSLALFPWIGSLGVAVGIAGATGIFSAYAAWAVSQEENFPMDGWGKVIGVSCLASPVIWWGSGAVEIRLLVYWLIVCVSPFPLGMVRMRDLSRLWKLLPWNTSWLS